MNEHERMRDAIRETAREFREGVQQRGGQMSQEQAERRVREAVNRGDAKRANNNR